MFYHHPCETTLGLPSPLFNGHRRHLHLLSGLREHATMPLGLHTSSLRGAQLSSLSFTVILARVV
jgi:hypothetical protein